MGPPAGIRRPFGPGWVKRLRPVCCLVLSLVGVGLSAWLLVPAALKQPLVGAVAQLRGPPSYAVAGRQRAWSNFSEAGIVGFSAYRLMLDTFVLVGLVHTDQVIQLGDKSWTLRQAPLTCRIRYAGQPHAGRALQAPHEARGAAQGTASVVGGFVQVWTGSTMNLPYGFLMLICRRGSQAEGQAAADSSPGNMSMRWLVDLVEFQVGAHVVAASPEDVTTDETNGPGGRGLQEHPGEHPLPQQQPQQQQQYGDAERLTSEAPPAEDILPDEAPAHTPPTRVSAPAFLVFCSAPIFGSIEPNSILQWMVYHQHHVGFDHFYLYNMMADPTSFYSPLKEYMERSMVTLIDFSKAADYPTWGNAQIVTIYDCLYMNKRKSIWAAYGDFDEYFHVRFLPPFNSLRYFLRHNVSHCSDVSRGAYFFQLSCQGALWRPSPGKLAVEMLHLRAPQPYCVTERFHGDVNFCPYHLGYRKNIVNIRKVFLLDGHDVYTSTDFGFPPLNRCPLNASNVYNAHFKGLMTARECHPPPAGHHHNSTAVADVAAEARLCLHALAPNCSRWRTPHAS